jgi:hypothetical protein
MRTIVAGSRGITNYDFVRGIIRDSGINVNTIISGGARGVDSLAIRYAQDNNIPYELFKPDWEKYGKRAGILRNCEMGDVADALIAIWDGGSRGTKHMIEYAMNLKRISSIHIVKTTVSIPTFIVDLPNHVNYEMFKIYKRYKEGRQIENCWKVTEEDTSDLGKHYIDNPITEECCPLFESADHNVFSIDQISSFTVIEFPKHVICFDRCKGNEFWSDPYNIDDLMY